MADNSIPAASLRLAPVLIDATDSRIVPPDEHGRHIWHWVYTGKILQVASWCPLINGIWNIGGRVYGADDPWVLREWKYVRPIIPPKMKD